uniref:Uncharacterized protein n=1 Tax=Arundo donax TaxID=35708 RepID=A0A0A9ET83_ARUDO
MCPSAFSLFLVQAFLFSSISYSPITCLRIQVYALMNYLQFA